MPSQWVDFKELRSWLKFSDLLAQHQVKVKIKGDRATGFCPLPGHVRGSDGKPRSPSFSVNLAKNIFRCFSCGRQGNALDFECFMQGMNPEDPGQLRKVALMLQEEFGLSSDRSGAKGERASGPAAKSNAAPDAAETRDPSLPVVVNALLDFELKHLDPTHPYLLNRGFSAETIRHFGLGFCSKGLMKDRIAIPLHDHEGKLIGYAGRLVDDALISDANPRYLFPSGREKAGVYHDFQKSRFLYRGFEVPANCKSLVVVESFTACWWLRQWGFSNIVALMGASCSSEQGSLIVRLTDQDGIVTILSDGDEAGERCAISIFAETAPRRCVRWAKLPVGKQPTDLAGDEVKAAVDS